MDVTPGPAGDCRYQRNFPRPHCLHRDYNPFNFTAYYSDAAIRTVIRLRNGYDTFRRLLETVPHNLVHASLGGQFGDMQTHYSPNDPIFWLLHSAIDKFYADWQSVKPSRYHSYSGMLRGRPVNATDILNPFEVQISDIFDTARLCYRYQEYSVNMQKDWNSISVTEEQHGKLGEGVHLPGFLPSDWINMK